MKYTTTNKPLVCMQTQSTCYKKTSEMTPKGVLWHSTGANNPDLKRYVQPSDKKPSEDTYTKEEWLNILGKNKYSNDWNHTEVQAGLNCWIGMLADGTVTTVQTMPWDFRPWGCGSGSKGSCNNGWIQFEICESDLADKAYFEKVYKEACEITAYICSLYDIDPNGTAQNNGVNVPTILCHADSYDIGLGSNHGDIYHWFTKHGKTMETARKDVAALLGTSASKKPATPSAAEVKTYEVVTDIPVYLTAADAYAKSNAKGTYAPGTYYIYNKYQNGVDGMFNISKDTSGASAGSWINPAENVAKVEEAVQKLYRVRLSWSDAKSQKGAFTTLQNAKTCCDEAGAGYKVFDWNGKEVYTYTAPEVIEPPVVEDTPEVTPNTPKAVYDLEYKDKHLIIDNSVPNKLDEELCTKAIIAIKKNNDAFDINIAKAFFGQACRYKIDPMRAIAQSVLETGWFKFSGSSAKPAQHNYCGLGVTGGGVSGAAFDTIEDGVKAQLQHLYAYGCKEALPDGEAIIDPRFTNVTRGIAKYWEQLAGRWAVPGYDGDSAEASMKAGTTYGQKIDNIYERLKATKITEADIKLYFVKEPADGSIPDAPNTPDIPVTPETEVHGDQVDIKKVNIILSLLEKLFKLIIDFFISKLNN